MGAQYGERAKDFIEIVFQDTYSDLKSKFDEPHLRADIKKYSRAIEDFSPQALEFANGIADSTETIEGQQSKLGPLERILLIGSRNDFDFRHPMFPHDVLSVKERTVTPSPRACSSLSVVGKVGGAKEDQTILAHNNDGPFGAMFHVSYIANPSEEGARRFWAISLAGQLTYTQVNDKGVAITETAGSTLNSEDCDFGVPWQVLTWHAISHSDSAAEAIQTITLGTREYARKTGRTTVLRTGGCNFLVADKSETYVNESTARRYATRRPGDAGETGSHLVLTNHNLLDHSFSEKNFMTDMPMSSGVRPGSDLRYWTLMWLLRHNHGRIDAALVQQFMSSHFFISEQGMRTDLVWEAQHGWVPANLSKEYSTTPCAHEGGYPEKQIGGTQESKVIIIREDEAEIRLVQGRPCEWKGNWDTVRLELE